MKHLILKFSSHDFVTLLLDRSYVSFLMSVVFSQVAFNMMNVVLIFLVFNLTSSNFLVSMILLISLIPQAFLSFLGGIVADTNNKKNILIYGNIGRAFVVFLLFIFNTSVAWVYLLALLVSIVTQFYIPAEAPIIPKLVNDKLLIAANSLFGLALFGSILVGFILAGPVYGGIGTSNSFLFIALLFALGALFAKFIPSTAITPGADFNTIKKRVKTQVRENFKTYLIESYNILVNTKGVLLPFILLVVSQVVIMVIAIIVPGYAKDNLHINVENVSLLLFAPASIGMILTALLVGSYFKNSNKDSLMVFGVIMSGFTLLLMPFTTYLAFVFLLALAAGCGNALVFIPAQTIIQEKIPENFRSKIYGLLFSLIGFFSILPLALVGGLADNIGVNYVLFIIGGIIFMGGVIQLIFFKKPH